MPGTAYRRGNAYEVRVANHLGRAGFKWWQTRNSRGEADIIASRDGAWWLVQVKGGKTGLSHEEWNDLFHLARRLDAIAVVADRHPQAQRTIRLRRITWVHQAGSRHWPCEPITP